MLRQPPAPVVVASILDHDCSFMIAHCVQRYPRYFAIAAPDDRKSALLRMQSTLGIEPAMCGVIYTELGHAFGVCPCELSCWRVQKRDYTLGELYLLLHFEAREQDRVHLDVLYP